jgi:DNA-binding beta-propeller fold protein YncE
MKRRLFLGKLFLLLLVLSFLLSACGPKEKPSRPAKTQKEERVTLAPDESVTLVWPSPPETPRIKFIKAFSSLEELGIERGLFQKLSDWLFGRDVEIFIRPYGITKVNERIYVTDPGGQVVHVFDLAKKKYEPFHGRRREPFISPIGITLDNKGNIYISDSVRRKVFVFNKRLRYLYDIGGDETFKRPAGVAVDPSSGFLYVVDNHAHQVLVFSKKNLLFTFGQRGVRPGEFNFPTNIAISPLGRIYITDSMNFRLQIFDRKGNLIKAFGNHGDGSGDFSWPKGVSVDSDEHIYIIETLFDAVQIFDMDGNYLLTFGRRGRGPGEFWLPTGLFIDDQDMLYVVDTYNQRIQVFQYLRGAG